MPPGKNRSLMGARAEHPGEVCFPGAVQIAKLRIQLEHEPPKNGLIITGGQLKPQKLHAGIGPKNFIREFRLQAMILSEVGNRRLLRVS